MFRGLGVFIVAEQYLDQRIAVINLMSSQASPTVIPWRGHEGREGSESGFELINSEMAFGEDDL